MGADLSQFHQVFFEETAEHLDEIEHLLLGVEISSPSLSDLNAIFRAAHSIKGNSGTFGFSDMAGVTHVLESLLDLLRKEEIALNSEMVDVFLEAVDVLRGQLMGHRDGAEVNPESAKSILQKLHDLADKPHGKPAEAQTAGAEILSSSVRYSIRFNPQESVITRQQFENLAEGLRRIGKLELAESDGNERSMSLDTCAGKEAVEEVFSFYAKPGEVEILEEGSGYGAPSGGPEQDPGYGFFEQPQVETDPGYGFFEPLSDVEVHSATRQEISGGSPPQVASAAAANAKPEQKYGRRSTDLPGGESASIRVGVDKVDHLINLVGELVITQAMIAQAAGGLDQSLGERLANGLAQLERNTRDLQESVMSIRMMPISFVFSRFPRLVRDLASKLGKEVELVTVGEGTELDKGLIEKITDPLTHLVRNSLDHGIEAPDVRVAKGKSAKGHITLSAAHHGGNIVISVRDDGAGLNRERILAKARERGIAVRADAPDQEVWQLIFAPGFSTAEVVTDVSGRGVGMDVVKRNITAMKGKVEIESIEGNGSCITIRLPLTLAILDGMSIAVGGQKFILPLAFVTESLQPKPQEIKIISGKGKAVHVRGEYLPVVPLHRVFNIDSRVTEPHEGILVLIEAEEQKVALLVDELVGQHQVVIKALETNFRKVDCISAATIMGDGTVALILDVAGLTRQTRQ